MDVTAVLCVEMHAANIKNTKICLIAVHVIDISKSEWWLLQLSLNSNNAYDSIQWHIYNLIDNDTTTDCWLW